jgi:hypothetical protein
MEDLLKDDTQVYKQFVETSRLSASSATWCMRSRASDKSWATAKINIRRR